MTASPFKLFESFDAADRRFFFGREEETTRLYSAVHLSNLVLLYGASGSGKTSLVRCGLANRFADTDWLPLFVRRRDDLNASLERMLYERLKRKDKVGPDASAADMVRALYLDYYRPVYLIFDQFEELYILGSQKEQDVFHRTVGGLLRDGLSCQVLLIVREEYLAYLSGFEAVVPSLFDHRLRIERMNDRTLHRVVEGMAEQGSIHIDAPGQTVQQIIDNVRHTQWGVDLTDLQVYLDRLYREDVARQREAGIEEPDRIMFDAALLERPRVKTLENVLSDFLDEQLGEIEDALAVRGVAPPQDVPLQVLFTMVTDEGTKRSRDVDGILQDLHALSPDDLAFCLGQLKDRRLLTEVPDE